MGMGAHRMNVPEELADQKLERAELLIALPPDWKLDHDSLQKEAWYWPVRLLKALARLPASTIPGLAGDTQSIIRSPMPTAPSSLPPFW